MTIIEQKTEGKAGSHRNEDGITANDGFIAVVDGSTSKTQLQISPGMSNGRFCMLTVCDFIKSMPEDISLEDFCEGITRKIRSVYKEKGIDTAALREEPANRMTASAVIFSRSKRQIWLVGDCQCLIDGVLHDNPKPYEKEIASRRAMIIREALAAGTSVEEIRKNDIGRKAILPVLKEACSRQNILYPVIDGFQIPTQKVKAVQIGDGEHEIVLASDGYPKLLPTLAESEEELHRLLLDDPLCINENIATKGLSEGQTSFDDRSYIRFLA